MVTRQALVGLCAVCVACALITQTPAQALRLPIQPRAALAFGAAASDRVNVTNAANLNDLTSFTVLMWVYPTAQTANRRWWREENSSSQVVWQNGDPNDLEFFVPRAGSGFLATTAQNFSTNTWHCVAFTYDQNGGTGNIGHVYSGSLTGAMAEASYATTPSDGSGATSWATANLIIGNRGNNTAAFQGRVALYALWNRALSLGEVEALRMRPFCSRDQGCVLFMPLGWAGTGTQADLSGNKNNGTVTGATAADHVPITRWP